MKAVAVCVVFLLAAVASGQTVPPGSLAAACGKNDIQFVASKDSSSTPLPIPEGASRLVIFAEPSGTFLYHGCSFITRLGIDGTWIGADCLVSYTAIDIKPGKHHLCANIQFKKESAPSTALNSFSADPGKAYYFRAIIGNDLESGVNVHLEPLDADEGAYLMTFWKVSKSQQK